MSTRRRITDKQMDALIALEERRIELLDRRLAQLGVAVPEPEPVGPLAINDRFEFDGSDYAVEEIGERVVKLRKVPAATARLR
jgi:hypothetical protein